MESLSVAAVMAAAAAIGLACIAAVPVAVTTFMVIATIVCSLMGMEPCLCAVVVRTNLIGRICRGSLSVMAMCVDRSGYEACDAHRKQSNRQTLFVTHDYRLLFLSFYHREMLLSIDKSGNRGAFY